jgi:hypothetical protein
MVLKEFENKKSSNHSLSFDVIPAGLLESAQLNK